MNNINQEVGKKIKNFRKWRGLTVQQLADQIFKSKGTLSKYESGDITLDLVTLHQIADALNIQVEQLLYKEPRHASPLMNTVQSSFFKNSTRFYSYFYDGRNNSLIRCVIDMMAQSDANRYRTVMYMNVKDFENYQECENMYWGHTEHYDTLTTLILKNQATPLENLYINILASFQESEKKWGLMAGVSFRPFMPIALKMLFSRTPMPETPELYNELKISKEDLRTLKIYNMLAVT
ncbi:helix-turn-helix transcriptional regulator [Paenibacillus barcinonensis]|uniref:Helix-turn-helix protein n=1 Tax=Paenibacillus barcinonensis TaxID=198119 RepID=A0A2V4VLM1_PAEBA|nr:helix-turn-helix transcriptional regulator [Paenibacillus barcinonensis]PYE45690.1 helix-turn-helix protein [Paenibacillus barcinonensis]QKS56267.1 helix-turn-helix transcriptional regulator [Paenibacillus barcinonensis]